MYRSLPGGLHDAGPNPQPTLPQRLHFCSSSSSLLRTYFFWARLRGRANRSRSARRAALPTILSPGFSNESAHDDDRVREGDPEVDDLPSPLCAPHQLLVSVIPGVGSLHNPTFRGL